MDDGLLLSFFFHIALINQTHFVKGVDTLWQEAQESIYWGRLLMGNVNNINNNKSGLTLARLWYGLLSIHLTDGRTGEVEVSVL